MPDGTRTIITRAAGTSRARAPKTEIFIPRTITRTPAPTVFNLPSIYNAEDVN
jgi:hypothetical protein